MKRIISILIVCVLTVMLGASAIAADKCRIYAEDTEASAGGTAMVTIKIQNNTGMALGKVKLSFDKTKLTPILANKGGLLAGAYMFTSNLEDPETDSTELDSITVSWVNMFDINGDGDLAQVEFAVRDGAQGDAAISVEITELADAAQSNINAEAAGGKVTFSGGGGEVHDEGTVLGFSNTTVSKTDSGLRGDVNLSVYMQNSASALFICAVYNDSGFLCAVKAKEETLKSGINEVSMGEITAAADVEKTYYMKVYMWNSMDGMVPLVDEPIMKKY